MTILDHYAKEKQRFLENCTQCGICAEECPILPYTDISEVSSQDIQEDNRGRSCRTCIANAISARTSPINIAPAFMTIAGILSGQWSV